MQFSGDLLHSGGVEIQTEELEDKSEKKRFVFSPNGFSSPVASFRQLFLNNELSNGNNIINDQVELKNLVQKSISPTSIQVVDEILRKVNTLNTIEKLLLYLKLPTGKEQPDPLKQPLNPLGSRVEITQTITWIKTHLKVDKETSLPKQDVYEEYLHYCNRQGVKALSTADFGKVMKQVFPDVRPRRLGTRGNSRYCYSGMTKRDRLATPTLPSLPRPSLHLHPQSQSLSNSSSSSSSSLSSSLLSLQANGGNHESLLHWASSVLGRTFGSLRELEEHIVANSTTHTPPKPNSSNGDAFISSSKLPKTPISPCVNRKSVEFDFKRKIEEDSSSSSKTPPDGGTKQKIKPNKRARTSKTVVGLARPKDSLPPPIKQRPNSENGNSEEEIASYFDMRTKSQLRMLLEKSGPRATTVRSISSLPARPATVDKCVNFVPASPNTHKKFSFAPISPVSDSPFLSPRPKQTPLLASMLVGSEGSRLGQEITPVPSELADFQESADSSGFHVLESSEPPPIIDSGELSSLFTWLDSEPKVLHSADPSPSKIRDPIVSGGLVIKIPLPTPEKPPLSLLEDDPPIPCCDDPFNDFAREMTNIGSNFMSPDL